MTSTTSTPENPGCLILKTDTRGRVRIPAQRREALPDEFEKSGLSGVKFSALSGIKYQTFANWVQQRRRKGQTGALSSAKGSAKSESVSWLEAVVQQAGDQVEANRGSLTLHLPGESEHSWTALVRLPLRITVAPFRPAVIPFL
jgi:hypothetical protein